MFGKKRRRTKRDEKGSECQKVSYLLSNDAYDMLCSSGYTRLDQNPEIISGCRKIAELIASMTIYLMTNSEKGDERIRNELSRKVDINPNRYMTRSNWIECIVMNMLLYGKGNSVVIPTTENGNLGDMIPVDPNTVVFLPDRYGYVLSINGTEYHPEDVLHFVYNPNPHYPWKGQGITTALKDVASNLKQAAATTKGFMESKWKPSVIVKVDGMIDEFSGPEGRRKLLKSYVDTQEVGEPWLIPSDQFEIEQIKPLSLADLAISDMVELDKRTVAAILEVPPFVLGIGEYNAKAWDNFISSRVRPFTRIIEQEMTRKLLISPKWYWKFNVASLYSYDLSTTEKVYSDLYVKGIVTGNEVRDKLSMSPKEGLDNLVILENYIPLDKIGEQLKLLQEGEGNE